ncbi:neuroligin-4, X-linked-like [Babylonia areolata]|uniref:neuroligin-4, X-linked-like n=1 Tax=Babylonia areolata TaxID=304850 RepID=UPI003FD5EA02
MMMMKAVTGVLAVAWVAAIVENAFGETVEVTTPYGALRGIRTSSGPFGGGVDKYLGVPFAKPPVGPLRFGKPEDVERWTGTRDATSLGPICYQTGRSRGNGGLTVSEDCLYLNVFTPQVRAGVGYSRPLPVMLWLHGGGYKTGTGSNVDLSALAARGVVGVSINYRLGALGFLCTGDAASPGNYGLYDQIRALEWVRDAISAFNGDPNDVTIFGQSAGSSSVSQLILTPAAKGLFNKAVMESGCSLAPFAWNYLNTQRNAQQLASRLGCNGTDSSGLLACLRTFSADSLTNAANQVLAENGAGVSFAPVVESSFGQPGLFPAKPEVLLGQGRFNDVTVVRGFNGGEMAGGVNDPDNDGITVMEFQALTKGFVDMTFRNVYPQADADKIFAVLIAFYLGNDTDPFSLRKSYEQMLEDYTFLAPIEKETQLAYQAGAQPQYVYRFSYKSANRPLPSWKGTAHEEEVQYVMGYPVMNQTLWPYSLMFNKAWDHEDTLVSSDLMTLWTNFAKYGNPTPPHGSGVGVQWLPWELSTPRLLDMGQRVYTMTSWPIGANLHLWQDVISALVRAPQEGVIG